MSASLARLRALLGDQLLVRGPHGLSMTPRAEALLEQLHPVMAGIEHMVAPAPGFVPATSRRTFSLIGTDFVEYALLPALAALLSEQAPDVQLVFKGPDFRHIEARMASGELNLAIGYCPGAPDALIRKAAFTEPFLCFNDLAATDQPACPRFVMRSSPGQSDNRRAIGQTLCTIRRVKQAPIVRSSW